MLTRPNLRLKVRSKIISDTTKIYPAYDILRVNCPNMFLQDQIFLRLVPSSILGNKQLIQNWYRWSRLNKILSRHLDYLIASLMISLGPRLILSVCMCARRFAVWAWTNHLKDTSLHPPQINLQQNVHQLKDTLMEHVKRAHAKSWSGVRVISMGLLYVIQTEMDRSLQKMVWLQSCSSNAIFLAK